MAMPSRKPQMTPISRRFRLLLISSESYISLRPDITHDWMTNWPHCKVKIQKNYREMPNASRSHCTELTNSVRLNDSHFDEEFICFRLTISVQNCKTCARYSICIRRKTKMKSNFRDFLFAFFLSVLQFWILLFRSANAVLLHRWRPHIPRLHQHQQRISCLRFIGCRHQVFVARGNVIDDTNRLLPTIQVL